MEEGENLKFKFLFGIALSFVCFMSFNLVGHAEEIDVLKGKAGFLKHNSKAKYINMTDGDPKTFDMFFLPETSPVYFDLGGVMTVNGFEMKAYGRGGFDRLNIIFLDENFNNLKGYRNTTEKKEMIKNVRYVAVSHVYINEINIYDFKVFGNDGKLSNVKDLKIKAGKEDAELSWVNPPEEDFSGVKIYRDGKLIETLDRKATSYIANNLKSDTKYNFKVTTLDKKGVETIGVSQDIKTLLVVPILKPPDKVYLTPQNGSLIIGWSNVDSRFIKGYNIYIDGKKVNGEVLTSRQLLLKNMENGKKYNVQVSTVNIEDVEGEKSKIVSDSPSKDAITIDYGVTNPLSVWDLLKTVGSISLWLSPFILLGLAVWWFGKMKGLVPKAVINKGKGEKK